MKDSATIAEIERLLAEDELSQRAIARLLHVSRGLVDDVAAGKRPDYAKLRQLRQEQLPKRRGKRQWCPTCGAKVRMPCVACRVERWLAEKGGPSVTRLFEILDGPLGMQLKGDHQRRYEEVRAKKLKRLSRQRNRSQRLAPGLPTLPMNCMSVVQKSIAVVPEPRMNAGHPVVPVANNDIPSVALQPQ